MSHAESAKPEKGANPQKLLNVVQNPLSFMQAEEGLPEGFEQIVGPLTHESVLKFLCVPGFDCSPEDFALRYREIGKGEPVLHIAPAEQRILDKLIWPLRFAKGSYMTGNYLGAIALCGMVAEMVAIVMFQISELQIDGVPFDEKMQEALLGQKFENLGQDRRVKVLEVTLLREPKLKEHFDAIRTVRRKYLHFWSYDHDSLSSDAVTCYKAAAVLVSSLLSVKIEGWGIKLHPLLEKYLEKHGQFQDLPAAGLTD